MKNESVGNSPTSVLFVINGMGLGNSTRCYAVIQKLAARGVRIFVATSANGLKFFAEKKEVEEIFPLSPLSYSFSGDGGINILKTLLQLPWLMWLHFQNEKTIRGLIARLGPVVMVQDSQYLFSTLFYRRLRIVAINNAHDVIKHFYRRPPAAPRLHLHLWLFEFGDFLYHKLFLNTVFVPQIPEGPGQQTSLIVREGLKPKSPSRPRRVLVMLSGATINSSAFDPAAWNLDVDIDVLGRDGISGPRLRYHGKITDNISFLNNADILVLNGGFSSLSETIALKKPAVIVPLAGHSEQYVNARRFENLGIGLVADAATVEAKLRHLLENEAEYVAAYERLSFTVDGAEKIASQLI